jgi:precorrin-2 dehydrogenase/sirohydrochlorin ferrochelatase
MEHLNTLYPVFIKLRALKLLIVGGGSVAIEKLHFILKNSPDANITVIAPNIRSEILSLFTNSTAQINLLYKSFDPAIISQFDLVIAATNHNTLNHEIYKVAKKEKVLINVADTPELCDFYLGSIVTKGNLKIAISTNGKSPTFAKRFRQILESVLPDEIDGLLVNLNQIRKGLNVSFTQKVAYLDKVTRDLVSK